MTGSARGALQYRADNQLERRRHTRLSSSAIARAFLIAAELQLRQLVENRFLLFTALAQPLFLAVTAMLLLRHRPDFAPVFVVVGSGLSGLWSAVLYTGSGAITRERWQGTLELLEGTPTPLVVVFGGIMLADVAFSALSMVLAYAVGAWLFQYSVIVGDMPGFGLSFVLTLASLWAIGMLFAPLSILWPVASRFLSSLEYPVYIIGGFLFPVLLLPGWLIPVSAGLPPFWAAALLHGSASQRVDSSEFFAAALVLLLESALALACAMALFRIVLHRARSTGTLAFG